MVLAVLVLLCCASRLEMFDGIFILESEHEILPRPEELLLHVPLFRAISAEFIAALVLEDQNSV